MSILFSKKPESAEKREKEELHNIDIRIIGATFNAHTGL